MLNDHLVKAENTKPLYQLEMCRTKNIYLSDVEITPIQHRGNIYCLSVDHGNFYMEHKGHSYWTGNSDAKIHLDRVSHLVTKLWMENKKVYGELEVLSDMPCGKILLALVEAQIVPCISSRGIGDMSPTVIEGTNEEGYDVLPGFRFVTWDIVAEPSVTEAQLSVLESKNRCADKAQLRKQAEIDLIKALHNTLRA
jgi:hypothetical protein